jgi:hypothetical protein
MNLVVYLNKALLLGHPRPTKKGEKKKKRSVMDPRAFSLRALRRLLAVGPYMHVPDR